jgi:carbon-monoxide dehydrogenase small subunit
MTRIPVSFVLNGRTVQVLMAPNRTLLDVLRDALGATEVKYGCGEGVCGTCTVLMDGESVSACTVLGVQAAGTSITTVRGMASEGEELHPLQRRFLDAGASQCGFCTAGMLLVAEEFVRTHPGASREDIRIALAGNLCRCTGYVKILDAVEAYAHSSVVERPP